MSDPPRPLRDRLRREAQRQDVPLDVIEKDFALGHVLASVFRDSVLSDALVFKGGTALKKAYFGDYRFSVDLDFTAVGGPRGDDLSRQVQTVAAETSRRLVEQGPFFVGASRAPEQQGHPGGQEAFRVQVQFPWERSPQCSIKLEITMDEPLMLPVERRVLLHAYDEELEATLRCYSLEEIVAEKLRTLRQAEKRLEQGRWPRNCARDYYDLWYLLTRPGRQVDLEAAVRILPAKCKVREVVFQSPDDFFTDGVVAEAARQWDSSLATLVRPLLPFESVIDELRGALATALSPVEA
jgi:predicted nucleotidyltransferase component of viral defense system